MSKPLHRKIIPATYVQLLFEYLEGQGHDPEKVLGERWPTPDATGLGGINVEHWQTLLEIAKDYLNDPFISLHVGQTITTRHLGVLGAVLSACDNFFSAMQRFERYQRLIETGRTVMVQFGRSLLRDKDIIHAVHFIHEKPEDTKPYEEYFGCPVLFEQPVPLIRFGLEMLNFPLKSPDANLVAILDKHADQLLESLPHEDEFIEQVRKDIAHLLHNGEPKIEQLADRLHFSQRTLQRRLIEAGTSFRKELNFVRYQLAQSYLKDPRLQVIEIALLLGYAEHSPFTRAYKEWSGKTPQQQRDEYQVELLS